MAQVDPKQIKQDGATTGQVLVWNGSEWAPGDASGEGGAGVNIFRQQTIAGEAITGTDTALSTALLEAPKSNAALVLFLNSAKLIQGTGDDYTVSGTTVTVLASSGTAPDITTDDTFVAYFVAGDGNETERQEEITPQAITSTDTKITTALTNVPKSPESVHLWVNGVHQIQGEGFDFVMDGKDIIWLAGTGTADDLDTGDTVEVWYQSGGGSDKSRQEVLDLDYAISAEDRSVRDLLDSMPNSTATVMLFHNGALQLQGPGNDYVLDGPEIEWLADSGTAVDLTTSHTLAADYVGEGATEPKSVHGDFLTSTTVTDSTSTSAVFATKGTLTTASVPPGKYRVAWQFQTVGGSSDTPEARIQVNGTTVHVLTGVATADFSPRSLSQGSVIVEVVATGVQTVTMDLRRSAGSGSAVQLVNGRMEFYREN